MWFAFPPGAEVITVEQQTFVAEAMDVENRRCFRAPAHFAPRILAIGGFALAGEITDKTLSDISDSSTPDGQAIEKLTQELAAREAQIKGLQEDYNRSRAAELALSKELEEEKRLRAAAEAKAAELEEQLEDAVPPAAAGKKG